MKKSLLSLPSFALLAFGLLYSGCPGGPTTPMECDTDRVFTPSAGDADGDGLSDDLERAGWTVRVDLNDDGDTEDANESYRTQSDPNNPDSDGDCLTDFEERVASIDPLEPDTDQDLLNDYLELKIFRSLPNDIDSDNDSRPEGTTGIGSSELGDYSEAMIYFTSPILADTDGDGISDRAEILESSDRFFKPAVADVPKIKIEITSSPGIILRGSVAETASQSWEVTRSTSTSESESTSSTQGSSESFTSSWEGSASAGFGVLQSSFSYGESTTTSSMYSFTRTQSRGYTQAHSEAVSEGREITNTQYEGELSVQVRIRNAGNLTFTLNSLSLLAQRWNVPTQELQALRSLVPETSLDGLTFAPNQAVDVLLSNTLDVQRTLDLMRNPGSLLISAGSYNLVNEFETPYSFNNTQIDSRTAKIIIDYGKSSDPELPTLDLEKYNVAVNQKFDPITGQPTGLSLAEIMSNVLEIPYSTNETEVDGVPTRVLTSVRTMAERADRRSGWVVLTNSEERAENPSIAFDDLKLLPGDVVHLIYVQDWDGDGLSSREELAAGASDALVDSDFDSVSDADEVKGREITIDAPLALADRAGTFTVSSSPGVADSDFDGLGDGEEFALGTDPSHWDTDRDFKPDTIDLEPLQFINQTLIELGGASSCAAAGGKTLACWGLYSNFYNASSLEGVTQFAAGSNDHLCAIANGIVSCEGDRSDNHGEYDVPELSNPYLVFAELSVSGVVDSTGVTAWADVAIGNNVPIGFTGIRQIVGSDESACLIHDGGLYCWQGDTDAIMAGTPNLRYPSTVSVRQNHGCAIQDSRVYCWGSSTAGVHIVPVSLQSTDVIDVTVSRAHNCVLTATREVRCWGIGAGATTPVPALNHPIALSSGLYHNCALDVVGEGASSAQMRAVCWGLGESDTGTWPNIGQSVDQALGALSSYGLTLLDL